MLTGEGNGPIDAFIQAIEGSPIAAHLGAVQISHYEERVLQGDGSDSCAIALIEITTARGKRFGMGCDKNIVTASFRAVLSALNYLCKQPGANSVGQTVGQSGSSAQLTYSH